MTVIETISPVHPQSSISGFWFYQPTPKGTYQGSRIFYQTQNGSICAIQDGKDKGPAVDSSHFSVKKGTPLRSVFYTHNERTASRTFYLNEQSEVSCFSVVNSKDWKTCDYFFGAVKDSHGATFKARSDSSLAAFHCTRPGKPTQIRVAYQLEDNTTMMISCEDDTIQAGGILAEKFLFEPVRNFQLALQGSSMALVNQSPKGADPYYHLFLQEPDKTLLEIVDEPKNQIGGPLDRGLGHKAALSATYPITRGKDFVRGQGQISLFYTTASGSVSYRSLDDKGNWGSATSVADVNVSEGSGILACSLCPENTIDTVKTSLYWISRDGKFCTKDL